LVCVAAGGLTTCDFAASTLGGMRQEEEVWPLTKKVNRLGEVGTFWPKFPLTVIPQLNWEKRPAPVDVEEFLGRIFRDVAVVNRDSIKLGEMYVDLNGWGAPEDYARAKKIAEGVLKNEASITAIFFAPKAT
ncbi:MAG: hypothetical protein WCN95_12895, partial [bacterium]